MRDFSNYDYNDDYDDDLIWTSIARDPFNHHQFRNRTNTPSFHYNCGGWALKTYSWYRPYDDSEEIYWEIYDLLANGYDEDEVKGIITDDCVKRLMEDFRGRLKIVESPDEVDNENDVIGFRLGLNVDYNESDDEDSVDWDFHFISRHNNEWTEKRGNKSVNGIELWDFDEPWIGDSIVYDGPIYWFTFEEGEELSA